MLGESGRTDIDEEQQNNVAALLLCDGISIVSNLKAARWLAGERGAHVA